MAQDQSSVSSLVASSVSLDDTKDNHEWIIFSYRPVSLFSLRMTHATSKGGKTLLIPTPYAFKMAMIDVYFRAFESNTAEEKARAVFDMIKEREVRFSPPDNCLVQNTFVKIRQEARDEPRGIFASSIALPGILFF